MGQERGTGRLLLVSMLAWLAGVAVQLREATLWTPSSYVACLVAAVAVVAAALLRRGWRQPRLAASPTPARASRWALPLLALAIGVAGYGCAGIQATLRQSERLAPELEGRDFVVTGVVATLPQQGASGLRFRFEVDPPTSPTATAPPSTLALGWYAGFHDDAATAQPRRALRAGQRWRFTVRLRQPHGNLNPDGFDYELLLFEQGVRATGYVRDAPPPELLEQGAAHPIERLRQSVRDAIYASVDDRRAAGVLAALCVGEQSAIDHDDWDLFRNTGVAHLVSISGLHVTMFAWLAGLAIAALWRRSERATSWLAAPHAARIGGLAAAAAYALFSGWGVPSQRTVWMLATVTALQLLGVRWPWALVLLAAAVVVTALDPWALLQAGFWLSFMAVGLLMSSSWAIEKRPTAPEVAAVGWRRWSAGIGAHLRSDLRTQVIATVGLTPLTLVFFQQVSLVGFAANLIAIPLVTLVITPLALLGALVPWLWLAGAGLVKVLTGYLSWLAAIPGAVWVVPVAPLWAQLGGLLAALLLVLPLPLRARLLALPLALPLLLPPHPLPPEGSFELVAADVGQGMAVLVRTRGHVLLFDAGPQYSAESDAGQRVLVPLLRARGDEHVDRLFLSHRDLDHVGGARSLLAALPVDEVWSSLEPSHPLHHAAKKSQRCIAGQAWRWEGVEFTVLHPSAGDYERPLKTNAMSCVLRVVAADGASAILAGDIEREQEAALVAAHGEALRSDVLLAPHHGSRTSSSALFLDAVRPRIGVFQSGYRNRFGHPAADVVGRYRERGTALVASPSCGAWQWRSEALAEADASGASTASSGRCEREERRRYWHHPGSAMQQAPAGAPADQR
ncbi:MAG: DNA internalization-related competence protein ComEC/Rec2 [Pseudomonadota bacterium]|nr:DNA internalization-related competence protein ComEC/Rec2 [Pseudomonadota bacterium]